MIRVVRYPDHTLNLGAYEHTIDSILRAQRKLSAPKPMKATPQFSVRMPKTENEVTFIQTEKSYRLCHKNGGAKNSKRKTLRSYRGPKISQMVKDDPFDMVQHCLDWDTNIKQAEAYIEQMRKDDRANRDRRLPYFSLIGICYEQVIDSIVN